MKLALNYGITVKVELLITVTVHSTLPHPNVVFLMGSRLLLGRASK